MTLIIVILIYFLSLVTVFMINEKVDDWEYAPAYAIYVLLAPVSLPIVVLTFVAYKVFNKYIKPRITK